MKETELIATTKVTTPLMQQYLRLKERYPNEILFFRLGDFYEMFYEDAIKASPLLEVVLTQRQSVPMCGVPHHAMTTYAAKLLKAGLSVALAEQLEDPKKTKGMVKRDVVRILTPGTLIEDELLPGKANNFLVAITASKGKGQHGRWALVAADVSTGRQWAGEMEEDLHWTILKSQLACLNPSEVIWIGNSSQIPAELLSNKTSFRFEPAPPDARTQMEQALKAIQRFLERDHGGVAKSLSAPAPLPLESTKTLFLDETAIRHLELVASSDPSRSAPTLLSVLDRTVSPLGCRLLRWWALHPSTDLETIRERLNQVKNFVDDSIAREELRQRLKKIADLERISVRAQTGSASPRDVEALRQSLAVLPDVKEIISKVFPSHFGGGKNSDFKESLTVPSELINILHSQLTDHPSAKVSDGGVIKEGFNPELDELRQLRRSGKKWIVQMEAEEKEKTGITTLKVGYNDVFGYYLEVSKSHISKVPLDWIRKQTLANGERYVTPALKEQEEKILGAEGKILQLETVLFAELVHQVGSFGPTLAKMADALAQLDAVSALAQTAVENNYVRPEVVESNELAITSGRHPVIERKIGQDRFIPNDLTLDAQNRIALITGPNMAGKSTYLRQTALITIMAQMGSFVPAKSATIGVVDKIFTRIGASDRLSQGQSTFMVEMKEVATLLAHSTPRSLLILDEVGRGTSTYDGVSIAWAVVEHLIKNAPRTLFATHYFELTQLADQLPGVFNLHATAKEWPGPDGRRQVVFLYQILSGAADRSYGIHVAEMAGLPEACINRAREILHQLESGTHAPAKASPSKDSGQLEFFVGHPVLEDLKKLPLDTLTPLEALNQLAQMKKKLN